MLKLKRGNREIKLPTRKNFIETRKVVYNNICDYIENVSVEPTSVYYDSWTGRVDVFTGDDLGKIWEERYCKIFSVRDYCLLPNGKKRYFAPAKMFVFKALRQALGTLAGADAAFVEAYYAGVAKTFYGDFKQC